MPLREDILAPIAGDNPSGIDLRYDTKLLIFDRIREARREDDSLAQGEWQSARKTANYALVVQLTQDTLATVSKDLQLAAWLAEALLHTEGFGGLRSGLDLTYRLVTESWNTVYPAIDDGDRELRARPLAWLGSALDLSIRSAPLVGAGYSLLAYKNSRLVGYEDQAKTDKEKQTRNALLKDGKLAPEVFDKAFAETPKAFYLQAEKDLDESQALVSRLEGFCDEKLEDDAPGFGKLRTALTDVRHAVHGFLEKKRETEPDPPEEVATPDVSIKAAEAPPEHGAESAKAVTEGEPADRRQAIARLVAAATWLRRHEPLSPAPYLLLRGFRWGELRGSARLADSALLEAPPTELRQQIKQLALARKWAELLEAGEQAFALPGSRAWLDLQRLSVAACRALGKEYEAIAAAIESELRTLLHDLPELLDATLLDDTPAANPETRAWLESLSAPPPPAAGEQEDDSTPHRNGAPAWLAPAMDSYTLAKDALAAGQEEKAFALMHAELVRQSSGRRRFRRRMQMAELAIAAGKDSIAQPLLEDIAAVVENHKLDDWEDPEQLARDLTRLMRYSKKIQSSSSDKQKLFERICRLDPVQALSVE
ncbi:MAG: type VI secretion system protein TssA [Acidobacteriaceae bacterium]